jgi:hypothetical protein
MDVMDPRQLPAPRRLSDARREADVRWLRARTGPGRGRRRVILAGGALIVAGAVAAGGVVAANSRVASNRNQVQCHTTLDVGRGDDFPGSSMAFARSGPGPGAGPVPVEDAIGSCRIPWSQGVLRLGEPRPFGPSDTPFPVPDLVGCVNSKGVAAVFPSSNPDVCDSLGLDRLLP